MTHAPDLLGTRAAGGGLFLPCRTENLAITH